MNSESNINTKEVKIDKNTKVCIAIISFFLIIITTTPSSFIKSLHILSHDIVKQNHTVEAHFTVWHLTKFPIKLCSHLLIYKVSMWYLTISNMFYRSVIQDHVVLNEKWTLASTQELIAVI